MKRWIATLAILTLDKMGALTKQECRAFGGDGLDRGRPIFRVCTKWRWHTDSHTYDWMK